MEFCECSDPGCPTCKGRCDHEVDTMLERIDLGGNVLFCEECAEDALDSGVFA